MTPRTQLITIIMAVCIGVGFAGAGQAGEAVKKAFVLDVATDNPARIVAPGGNPPVIVVHHNTTAAFAGTLQAKFTRWDGRSRDIRVRVELNGRQTARIPVPSEEVEQPGIVWVEATLLDSNGQDVATREGMAFAVLHPAGPLPWKSAQMRLGIAYGAGHRNSAPESAQIASMLGFHTVRTGPEWNNVQKDKSPPDFSGENVQAFVNHEQAGLRVQPLVSGTANWAKRERNDKRSDPPRLDAWAAWCSAQAGHLRGRADYWEIWNEPDIGFFTGTTDEYIELLRIASDAIRAADPQAKVMTGGFASLGHGKAKPDMIERVLREAGTHVDALAYHKHGPFSEFQAEIDGKVLPLLRETGRDIPIYFTETGVDTRDGQHRQAGELVKKIVFAWSRGAVAYTWYNLYDHVAAEHPKQAGRTYGLMTAFGKQQGGGGDFSEIYPKASLVAFNTLASVLGGAEFVEEFASGPDFWGYAFRKGDDLILVTWNENRRVGAPAMMLKTRAESAELLSIIGVREKVATGDGELPVHFASTPEFLIIRGAADEGRGFEKRILARSDEGVYDPAAGVWRSSLHLTNIFPRETAFELEIEPGKGWEHAGLEIPKKTDTLQPGASLEIPVEFRVRPGTLFAHGTTAVHTIVVSDEVSGLRTRAEFPVTLRMVTLPSSLTAAPQVMVDDPAHVWNRFEHDPKTAHLMWRGWTDLSAQLFLAEEEATLRAKVRIIDNHVLGKLLDKPTEGDSLSLSFAPVGGDADSVVRFTFVESENGPVLAQRAGPPVDSVGVVCSTARFERGIEWDIAIPWQAIGSRSGSNGFFFNLLLTDNDGDPEGLRCTISAAPGGDIEKPIPAHWIHCLPPEGH